MSKSERRAGHQEQTIRVQSPNRVLGCACGSLLLLGGCTAIGPDFQRPETKVTPEFQVVDDKRVLPVEKDDATWWDFFNDPVLTELIQLGYQQNLDLQILGLQVLEARAQLGIALGNLYPQQQQAQGSATANQTSANRANTINSDRYTNNLAVGLSASWELDFWGRFRRGIESADANLLSSVANYDSFLVLLNAQIATTYTVIRTFEQRIQIARDNVVIQARSLRLADVRFRSGATTELDVQQARSLLRETEATVPRFQIGLRQAENALSILLGRPPGDVRQILDKGETAKIPTAPPEVAVGIPADLLRRRPDVRAAELTAAAQSAEIGIAESDLYPRIALLGTLGLVADGQASNPAGDSGWGNLLDTDSIEFSLGGGFSWNILNYGRIKNNVRVQDAQLQQFLVNYQNTVLQAAQEVEDGLIGFVRSQDQTRFLGDGVAAAQRAVDLALIQYRDGAVDYTRVLQTQTQLVQQQDNFTVADGDIATNLIAVYRALGGGWQLRQERDFIPESMAAEMAARTDWGELLEQQLEAPQEEPVPLPTPARDQTLFPNVDW